MEKSPEAFRTISEVAESMDLPQHVLRFWETRFPQIRPLKRAGGRRYYRPEDVERLRLIKRLLYDEGYTIKGVQKLFKDQGAQALLQGFEPRFAFGAGEGQGAAVLAEDEAAPAVGAIAPDREREAPDLAGEIGALRAALGDIAEAQRILRQARVREA
jgi:DNA-binding transcriptional MerR regulator